MCYETCTFMFFKLLNSDLQLLSFCLEITGLCILFLLSYMYLFLILLLFSILTRGGQLSMKFLITFLWCVLVSCIRYTRDIYCFSYWQLRSHCGLVLFPVDVVWNLQLPLKISLIVLNSSITSLLLSSALIKDIISFRDDISSFPRM